MKKIIALVLCFVMALSVTGLCAVEDSYKDVLQKIKTRITITDEYDDFSANQSFNGADKIYTFNWSNSKTNDRLTVEALENGIVIRINKSYEEIESEKAMLDISKEEALKKAISAFNKINPDIEDEVVITNSSESKTLWESRQYFAVQRIKNGIHVVGDSGYIEMDANADNILWYYLNWSNYDNFETVENAISLEKAKEIYAEKLGLCLTYKMKIKDGKKTTYLVYARKQDENMYVDFSGNIIKCNPYATYRTGSGALKNNMAMLEDSAVEFSKAELSEFEKLDGMLSKEEVEKIVSSTDLFALKDFLVEYAALTRDYYEKDKYIYSLNYKKDKMTASVTLDASTGEVLSFYKYIPEEGRQKVSVTDATKTLDATVKALCKTYFDEYEHIQSEDFSDTYYRIVDGVRFPNDSITVSVDEFTGELVSYSKKYSSVDFQSKENVISPNMAYKCAFDLFSYGLKYVPSYNEETNKTDIKLVFDFENDSFELDPFTGENYVKDESKIEYEDIETHYAKDYIKALAEYGIGIGNKEFKPDAAIKQKEYITLLVKVFYRYYSDYLDSEKELDEAYKTALREGIIEKEEVDYNAFVTRENAAKYLVNTLGYKNIAKAENIFNCPFSDVSENKGSITLLYGLNVVKGDENGKFNPYDNLSRADTMIMIYKYLSQ